MTHEEFATVLDETPGRTRSGRSTSQNGLSATEKQKRAAKFDRNVVRRLEIGEAFAIWKLARYANWSGYPVSIILLVQELSAHLRDGKTQLAIQIAEATKQLCEQTILNAERLCGDENDIVTLLSAEERVRFIESCANLEESDTDRDRFVLIANELFRMYEESAHEAKRAEWASGRR